MGNVVRQLEDNVLIGLLQTDPERGLDAAIRQYGGLCKAVIVRILGEGADAEECLADTFAALWRHAGKYRPDEGGLKPWLCVIARNQAVSLYRKRRRQSFIPEEERPLGNWQMIQGNWNAGRMPRCCGRRSQSCRNWIGNWWFGAIFTARASRRPQPGWGLRRNMLKIAFIKAASG